MKALKKTLSLILVVFLLFSNIPVIFADNDVSYWVESSYINVMKSASTTNNTEIHLIMAKNEYEAVQIVVKSPFAFSVNSVSFSDLLNNDGINQIPSSQISYNPIGYEYLPSSTSGINTSIRDFSGYCPEWLLNNTTVNVAANEAQPIWVTVHTLASQAPGTYSGTVTVNTSLGSFNMNITVEVYDVAIPTTEEANCNLYFWQATVGWYNKPRNEDQIELLYGSNYTRYSNNWWDLMDKFAESGKRNRNNFLMVPTVTLLFDGGTTLNADETYTFNWSRFDEFVSFMLERGYIKRLVGNQLVFRNAGWSSNYESYIIDRDNNGNPIVSNVAINSQKSINWFPQFLTELETHLASKQIAGSEQTWLDIWEQAIADEPYSQQNSNDWVTLANLMNTYAPTIFIQEAIQSASYNANYINKLNAWIMQLDIYENNRAFYNTRQASGDEVWIYTCTSPRGNYLNRFVDQPVWMGRSLLWLVYQYGLDGYLHWGWNAWHYSKPNNPYGDTYSVWPDVQNGTITETIRLAAIRDGAEEYELLKILEQDRPIIAHYLCDQVVTNATEYNSDPNSLKDIRDNLIKAAAGEPIEINIPLPVLEDYEGDQCLVDEVSGTWSTIQLPNGTHKKAQSSTTGESILVFDLSTWENFAVSADFSVNNWINGDAVGVLGRYQDSDNYYHWRLGNISGNTVLQLYKKVNGSFTKLFEQSVNADPYDENHLKLVMSGNQLQGYLNNLLVMQLTDSSLNQGSAGVRAYATSFYTDNLCITDPNMSALEVLPQELSITEQSNGLICISGSWEQTTEDDHVITKQITTNGEAVATWGHVLWENYTVTSTIRGDIFNGDSSVGLLFGYKDLDNYYLWRMAKTSNGQPLLQLFSKTNGAFTKLYEQTAYDFTSLWKTMKIVINGNNVFAYYNNQLIYQYSVNHVILGLVGYRGVGTAFSVQSLQVEPTPLT